MQMADCSHRSSRVLTVWRDACSRRCLPGALLPEKGFGSGNVPLQLFSLHSLYSWPSGFICCGLQGIQIEVHAANQRKALHLDILKTQTNLASDLSWDTGGVWGGEVCAYLHILICSPDTMVSSCVETQPQVLHSLFICWLASQLFPRFPWSHSS